MVEPRTFNPFVVGSSPTGPTRKGGASASPFLFPESILFDFRDSTARFQKSRGASHIYAGRFTDTHRLACRVRIAWLVAFALSGWRDGHSIPRPVQLAAFALPNVQLPLSYQTLGSSAGSRSGPSWRLRVQVRLGDQTPARSPNGDVLHVIAK